MRRRMAVSRRDGWMVGIVGYLGNDQEVDRALYWAATKERWREKQIPGGEMIKARWLQLAKHRTKANTATKRLLEGVFVRS